MPVFVLYSILKAVLMTKAAKPKQATVTSGVDPVDITVFSCL